MCVCVCSGWVGGWVVGRGVGAVGGGGGGGLSLCQYDMVTLMSCSNRALWQSFNGRCSIQDFQLCLSFYPCLEESITFTFYFFSFASNSPCKKI